MKPSAISPKARKVEHRRHGRRGETQAEQGQKGADRDRDEDRFRHPAHMPASSAERRRQRPRGPGLWRRQQTAGSYRICRDMADRAKGSDHPARFRFLRMEISGLACLRTLRASLRRTARFSAPWSLRFLARSSSKTTSSTQWTPFSMPSGRAHGLATALGENVAEDRVVAGRAADFPSRSIARAIRHGARDASHRMLPRLLRYL